MPPMPNAENGLAIAFLTFNPDSSFADKALAVAAASATVIVVDDGSRVNTEVDRYEKIRGISGVEIIEKGANLGIASSFNIALRLAADKGARRLLTFDQDTQVSSRLVDRLTEAADILGGRVGRPWGVVGPGQIGGMQYAASATESLVDVAEIIQSAAMFSIPAVLEIGGALDELFIDCVDTDLCLRLRSQGYGVYAATEIAIDHPIGTGQLFGFFGRKILISGHSAFRRYFIVRNRIFILKRYGIKELRWAAVTVRRLLVGIALSLTVESERRRKLQAVLRGTSDGLRGNLRHRGALPRPVKSDKRTVAAVVVLHNGMRFLGPQLQSILDQTTVPDLVVLVDDCSVDQSLQFAERFLSERSNVRILSLPRFRAADPDVYTRIAANFTLGIRAASQCEYIALSDQDDIWLPDRIERQLALLAGSGAEVTVGNGHIINGHGQRTGQFLFDIKPELEYWCDWTAPERLTYVLRNPMATGAAMMVSAEFVESLSTIPHGWLHDRWISLVAATRASLVTDLSPVIEYRVYEEQAVGLSKVTGTSGIRRLRSSLSNVRLTLRKLRDVRLRLRKCAQTDDMTREFTMRRILKTYFAAAA